MNFMHSNGGIFTMHKFTKNPFYYIWSLNSFQLWLLKVMLVWACWKMSVLKKKCMDILEECMYGFNQKVRCLNTFIFTSYLKKTCSTGLYQFTLSGAVWQVLKFCNFLLIMTLLVRMEWYIKFISFPLWLMYSKFTYDSWLYHFTLPTHWYHCVLSKG